MMETMIVATTAMNLNVNFIRNLPNHILDASYNVVPICFSVKVGPVSQNVGNATVSPIALMAPMKKRIAVSLWPLLTDANTPLILNYPGKRKVVFGSIGVISKLQNYMTVNWVPLNALLICASICSYSATAATIVAMVRMKLIVKIMPKSGNICLRILLHKAYG